MYNEVAVSKMKTTSKVTENQVPELARAATGSAYRRAIRAGSVVVYRIGDLSFDGGFA